MPIPLAALSGLAVAAELLKGAMQFIHDLNVPTDQQKDAIGDMTAANAAHDRLQAALAGVVAAGDATAPAPAELDAIAANVAGREDAVLHHVQALTDLLAGRPAAAAPTEAELDAQRARANATAAAQAGDAPDADPRAGDDPGAIDLGDPDEA